MTRAVHKLTFATHVTSSAGWVGAALVFIALATIGLNSQDERVVRGAYLLMAPAAWFVLVPLAHASLISGIALSLGTAFGLFRHYWVVAKLVITAFSTVILLVYMNTFRQMAQVAADPVVDLSGVRNASPLVHAILAVFLLLTATALAVYKPFGMTPYGRRRRDEQRKSVPMSSLDAPMATPGGTRQSPRAWFYLAAVIAIGTILLFVLLHFSGSAFQH